MIYTTKRGTDLLSSSVLLFQKILGSCHCPNSYKASVTMRRNTNLSHHHHHHYHQDEPWAQWWWWCWWWCWWWWWRRCDTYLSKTSRIINMQNAKGHARYRSSACGKVDSSVFFKSAQVTLCGSQNLSFQNHARIPAISSGSEVSTPALMCSQWPMRLATLFHGWSLRVQCDLWWWWWWWWKRGLHRPFVLRGSALSNVGK